MKMITADHAGFCFGVKRAVDTVYKLIAENQDAKIYTLGKLIHNPHIIDELQDKGVTAIENDALDRVMAEANAGQKTILVIRTHGIDRAIDEQLCTFDAQCPDFSVVDCTCPFVKKIHNIAKEQSADDDENTVGMIFGDENHPEVAGIRSYFTCPVFVFSDADALQTFLDSPAAGKIREKRLIFVSQTTQKLSEYKKSQKILKKDCTNPIIFDTICNVTEDRQCETDKISRVVDAMLVIGGRNSSNTQKLYDIAKRNCVRTCYVESLSDLPIGLLRPDMTLGITAGASTPRSIIEEVELAMTEEIKEESFAELLDESFQTLNTGDVVKGVITSVLPNEIHVDIGGKVTGVLPYDNITDDPTVDIPATYKVGDEIETVAVRVSDVDGVATLSKKKIDNANNWKTIVDANENGTILEGRVVDILEKGVIIIVDGCRVFVPASHSGVARDGKLEILRGTTQKIRIIEINEQRRRAVGSIREVLREERRAQAEEFWATVEKGKVYEGVVKSFMPYGAFVDLGGVDGMVHTSELSWCHVKHPSDVVSLGQTVTVYVKDFDPEKKRISLGYKKDEDNPWTLFTNEHNIGDVVTVKIANMMPFGAFAEIIPGVDGLIHISQIAEKRIASPADVLEKGQMIDAKIISIDEDKHQIGLSILALIEDAKNNEEAENRAAAGDALIDDAPEA